MKKNAYATGECSGPPKFFSQSVLVTHQWVTVPFIASSGGCRYTWGPFRPNSMSIRAITFEQEGAKAIVLFSSTNRRKTHLSSELKSFRKD
jgi:hypothetical protein